MLCFVQNHHTSNVACRIGDINKLVYFEYTEDVTAAISREKQIKGWCRQNKNELIENTNPEWKDLSEGF